MRMPTVLAASSTFVPSGTDAFLPSIVSSTRDFSLTRPPSTVELAGHDGQAAQVGGEIGDHRALQHLVDGREDVEPGRAAMQAVWLGPAVGDQIEAELADRA